MDLRESKFYYAGDDLNFAGFSDYPCRARLTLEEPPSGCTAYPSAFADHTPIIFAICPDDRREVAKKRIAPKPPLAS